MIEHDTTVADEGVALLTDEWQDKPRLEALLRSYLNRCQELEDTIWNVLESRLIDNAVNSQLDTLGKLVGQPRLGLDDATYRTYVKARAIVNRSKGRAEDVLAMCTTLFGAVDISFTDIYPASFVISTDGPISTTLAAQAFVVARLIDSARAAGVGSSLHFTTEAATGLFLLSATTNQDLDTAHGLADSSGTTGGTLIGAF